MKEGRKTMDKELSARVEEWLRWDRNDETRAAIEKLRDAGDVAALRQALSTRLEFGTAGLRAAMGPGSARMNDLTVIQATQGLAAYLRLKFAADALASHGVVIGFDGRHHSKRFARLTANVFLAANVKTRLFGKLVPTPFVPFAVRHFGCVAGVMVTASHNPKDDNGYKVYWDNGAQIVPPHDAGIARCIEEHLQPVDSSWVDAVGAVDPFTEVHDRYFATLRDVPHHAEQNPESDVKFTYTAMHGVGTPFALEALATFGVPRTSVVLVDAQAEADPDFPTVAFPNPEEGKSALDLAFSVARGSGSRVIIANDPDADRLAVAEQLASGAWHVFSGNQLGALLGWWVLKSFKEQQQGSGGDLKNCVMLSSAVSSMILRTMAAAEGFAFEETLTGFKWMGSRAEQLQRDGRRVLFAFEEAIGFMIGTRVYDKDGVTAAAVVADMVNFLQRAGKTLFAQLDDVYRQYGHHVTYSSYVVSKSPEKTKEMFDTMRTLCDGAYPTSVAGVRVTGVRDLSVGSDTRQSDGKAVLPSSKVSPMVTLYFENDVAMTIRGSGTEPKIKWYSERIVRTPDIDALKQFVDRAVEELMRPSSFGFAPRPT